MEKIRVTIEVPALPAGSVYVGKDGKKRIEVDVMVRKSGADEYGNTHTVSAWDKNAKERVYVGKGKLEVIGDKAPAQPVDLGLNNDDLPL